MEVPAIQEKRGLVALVAAGGDTAIKNGSVRTPLRQARFLGLADLAQALSR